MTKKKRTSSALRILDRVTGDDQERCVSIEREILNSKISSLIHRQREAAGLTQVQLAELIGTKQSVISRLEGADYDGHTLSMLLRIAVALNTHVQVNLNPKGKKLAEI